jgi:maltooligosyltrehalose trehalohydrolase
MKHIHDMRFGASRRGDQAAFRLWAPKANVVELALDRGAGDAWLPMDKQDAGWFGLTLNSVPAGVRYRYRVDTGLLVPDPASRFNPDDVHGQSELVDPAAFEWRADDWRGRPWHEAVIYELHVGTFSPEGTYAGVESKLDYLLSLGVTAIELMPLAEFPGSRGWGYDGVLPYSPDSSYGRPEDLKRLIDEAHRRNLMVLLDVVYNHFGPEGNYLHTYAPQFFTDRHHTPWGSAINFDGGHSRTVRDFYVHNALYWLEEFQFDGLRFDAVHAIRDESQPHILSEIAEAVRNGPGRERHIHLVLENDDNRARFLERDATGAPLQYSAQWNDDEHHCLHVLLTGENDGYYADYARTPASQLGRCLAEGFAYQGDPSAFRDGSVRGEPSAHLPPGAFVCFMQNHDQVGNRAFGERLAHLAERSALTAATAILLLAPSPPLIFMGDEFAAATPFLYFCDFGPELAQAVTEGRRKEFSRFARFQDPAFAASIPDPGAPATFGRSKLDWASLDRLPHSDWLALYRSLLDIRQREIFPLIPMMQDGARRYRTAGERGLEVRWQAGGSELVLLANLGGTAQALDNAPAGRLIYSTSHPEITTEGASLPPWSATWLLAQR